MQNGKFGDLMFYEEKEEKKEDRLVIRCATSTKWKFKKLVLDMKAPNYEIALLNLIALYYQEKEKKKISVI